MKKFKLKIEQEWIVNIVIVHAVFMIFYFPDKTKIFQWKLKYNNLHIKEMKVNKNREFEKSKNKLILNDFKEIENNNFYCYKLMNELLSIC